MGPWFSSSQLDEFEELPEKLRIERHRLRKLPVEIMNLDEQAHPAMRDPGNDLRDITCAPMPVKAPQSGEARCFP